jgi:hypothetical protein
VIKVRNYQIYSFVFIVRSEFKNKKEVTFKKTGINNIHDAENELYRKIEKKPPTSKNSMYYLNFLRIGEISAFVLSKPISSSRAEARDNKDLETPFCCLGIKPSD